VESANEFLNFFISRGIVTSEEKLYFMEISQLVTVGYNHPNGNVVYFAIEIMTYDFPALCPWLP
jgi:hypothetical protein